MAEQASGPTQPPQQDGKHLSPQGDFYRADLTVLVEGLRPVRPRISKQQSTGWQITLDICLFIKTLWYDALMLDMLLTERFLHKALDMLVFRFTKACLLWGQHDVVAHSQCDQQMTAGLTVVYSIRTDRALFLNITSDWLSCLRVLVCNVVQMIWFACIFCIICVDSKYAPGNVLKEKFHKDEFAFWSQYVEWVCEQVPPTVSSHIKIQPQYWLRTGFDFFHFCKQCMINIIEDSYFSHKEWFEGNMF